MLDISEMKVSINENMGKLVNIFPGGGTLVSNGNLIEKPDEVTFVK